MIFDFIMINSAAKRRTDFRRQRGEEAASHSDINVVSYQRQSAVRDRIRKLCNRKTRYDRETSYHTTPVKHTINISHVLHYRPLSSSVHHIPDGAWIDTLVCESATLQLCTVCSFNMRRD